ncbi:hypothetical protein [Stenotrophomonas sp.]|uniref:hypothetical protein n=1 Tax=Stenotrophomonas sp. TaxID=69392 RepID=UPI0028A95849|nr:hypothetical protein [Stenotrophomonas sp.]
MIQIRMAYLLEFELSTFDRNSPLLRGYAYVCTFALDEPTALGQARRRLELLCIHPATLISTRCIDRHVYPALLPLEIELISRARQSTARTSVLVRPSLHL